MTLESQERRLFSYVQQTMVVSDRIINVIG